ncbi:MAG: phosphodiester glycosidase family protein [Bacteroidetes bacterium]|nr:phosphodiester glycosidase family protein [Bacteroidota bacterium]
MKKTVTEMIKLLNQKKIKTWFDLGLFLDELKENNSVPAVEYNNSFNDFRSELKKGGIGFVTFSYSIDGVTIEIEKYAKLYRKNLGSIPIHYISGEFKPEAEKIVDPETRIFVIKEAKSFDSWPLYNDFFYTKLERGSKEYNKLILKFWKEVLVISEKLGKYIEKNNIKLLFIVNICSNPGNVSFALATVLVSEIMGIPVICNNHDFYWEGGNREIDIREKDLEKGPRDFFFINSHIGEFFSIIEILFPWESRSWISVNINQSQSDHLIEKNGHNPANIGLIGTAVDAEEYKNPSKRIKINTYYQFEKILSRYKNTLISYSVKDVIENRLVIKNNPRPILIGSKTKAKANFLAENIMFMQPTRIIARKRIETSFRLINKMFKNQEIIEKFRETGHLKLTLLVTGPIANGQFNYFNKILKRFSDLLRSINKDLQEKIYLAFLFSELDKEKFLKRFKNPVGIPELYNIASLILLPSETEGRGLPIIEAAAYGIPIFCSRYYPENVYSDVIGENLPEEDRLRVIEFDGKNINKEHVKDIFERVFFPHNFSDEYEQNINAVNKRYSLETLYQNIKDINFRLYNQLKTNAQCMEKVKDGFNKYRDLINNNNEGLKEIIKTEKRHYLPGYGRLLFMLKLKSLIDPSYFRVEEQEVRGMAFMFAKDLINNNPDHVFIEEEKIAKFYNSVDNIFRYREGEIKIRHDHSMSYRHRNKYHYAYREFTIQEITGLINLLYHEIIRPTTAYYVDTGSHFFTDWNLALSQLTSSKYLAIDDREELLKRMHENVPIGIFSGRHIMHELEFFALQSVRSRLNLKIEEELTKEKLSGHEAEIEPVFLFAQEKSIRQWADADEIIKYIKNSGDRELKLLYEKRILRIVRTKQLCVGIHFLQLGEKALKILWQIKNSKGFIISNRRNAVVMTDILDIDRFHIGRVKDDITANIMGIPRGTGYIQFVPAGMRPTLAYPTPIQTAKDFSEELNGDLFKSLCKKIGKEKVLEELKKDAEQNGSPVKFVLNNLKSKKQKILQPVKYSYLTGVYNDGHPWNGVLAKIETNLQGKKWSFTTVFTKSRPKKVTDFIKEFEKREKKKVQIGWNGGYILNPELVGKLGLPEAYIGSPLGLLIKNGRIICPPLYNKPAFLVKKDGKLDILRVNCSKGLEIKCENKIIDFTEKQYNIKTPGNKVCYYDLNFDREYIPGDGRIIIRLAGNTIKDVVHTKKEEKTKIIPVGLTLSFPAGLIPESMKKTGRELSIKIKGLEKYIHGIEAGPMLVERNNPCLDMQKEGWKTKNSIRTQAARIDYTDMRGPKIAAGLDKNGNMYILAVNGRIRESVGATHHDMAEILIKQGIENAMGFDPGGSSTIVVDGIPLNISPYNSEYEKNVYSMPPEPRAVSNAVLAVLEDKKNRMVE